MRKSLTISLWFDVRCWFSPTLIFLSHSLVHFLHSIALTIVPIGAWFYWIAVPAVPHHLSQESGIHFTRLRICLPPNFFRCAGAPIFHTNCKLLYSLDASDCNEYWHELWHMQELTLNRCVAMVCGRKMYSFKWMIHAKMHECVRVCLVEWLTIWALMPRSSARKIVKHRNEEEAIES